jgi:hypothetical protein
MSGSSPEFMPPGPAISIGVGINRNRRNEQHGRADRGKTQKWRSPEGRQDVGNQEYASRPSNPSSTSTEILRFGPRTFF